LIGAIIAATAIVLAQAPPRVQESTTVTAPPLREPDSIVRAEHEFARGSAAAAVRLIDSAIEDEERAKDPDPALLANLYNCRGWITLKSPGTLPLDRQHNLRNAEAYAARAAELVGASDLYWHDYAAIRIRRALEERQLSSVQSRIPEYIWSRSIVRRPLRSLDSRAQFETAVRRCLLDTTEQIDPNTPVVSHSEPVEVPINTQAQLLDALIRERPASWQAWAELWHVARSQRHGETLFRRLVEHPSGDIRAVAAAALPMLESGDLRQARMLLIAAHNLAPESSEVLFALTVTTLAACRVKDTQANFEQLSQLDASAAFILQESGVHRIIDRSLDTSDRDVGQVLFIAADSRSMFTSEALDGLCARNPNINTANNQKLLREIAELRVQLENLSHHTAAQLARLEAADARTTIEIRQLAENEEVHFRQIKSQMSDLSHSLRLTQSQVNGIVVRIVTLDRHLSNEISVLDHKIRTNETITKAALDALQFQATSFSAELSKIEAHNTVFARLHHKEIAFLMEALNSLDRWRSVQELKQRVSAIIHSAAFIFEVAGTGVSAIVANFLTGLVELKMALDDEM
jgi:hypothetical protein